MASRHFCLAAATPLPEPAVDAAVDEVGDDEEVDDDEEVFELPHALSLDPPCDAGGSVRG